ncbi:response regulator [Bdellovibrio sp. SKB1291214]|uniref:response regulator n=1 Tax=Bdellovibrio sp. SKB1291214 TaxID=1732569 RepID=UPI002240B64A|nr:response regulator [Bdellovibrio sp. SKB1291214]UYL09252.1 response regulator [Bdellovibrio sp. SKB1291214]
MKVDPKKLDILLIEDNDEHAEIISRHLRRVDSMAITVTREFYLAKGVQRLTEKKFDAVLLDLHLPDSNFMETLPRVARVAGEAPIIVLSALDDRGSTIKAAQDGASDFLNKAHLSSELMARTILSSIERKESEIKIKHQLHQTALLSDLSQFALNEVNAEKVKLRCRQILMNSLLVDYVHFTEPPEAGKMALAQRPSDGVPFLFGELEFLGMQHEKEMMLRSGLRSGVNVVIVSKDVEIPPLVMMIYDHRDRTFKYDEIEFIKAVANILSSVLTHVYLEKLLQQKIESLKQAHQKKDEFLATLSHELRTPLNIITGYLEIVRESQPGSEEYQSAMEIIDTNLKIETRLIGEILDMSRIITGKMKLDLSFYALDEMIDSSIESLSLAMAAKKIHLELHVSPNLGRMWGDRDRMRQVIWNLVSNAVKFTPQEGIIKIFANKVNDLFEFTIEDNGVGIIAENQQDVFNRFWQEDSAITRQHMGLGLGLGIVRHIVELHGGTVEVFSAGRNQGTRFTIHVPIQQLRAVDATPVEKPPEPEQTVPNKNLRGMHLLAIDDSEDSLNLLQHLLKKSGATVEGTSDPQRGLDLAKNTGYDVIICDIGMPILDGYSLISQLRQWEEAQGRPATSAIALTAYVGKEDIDKALSVGFQAHMPKPLNLPLLKQKILELAPSGSSTSIASN